MDNPRFRMHLLAGRMVMLVLLGTPPTLWSATALDTPNTWPDQPTLWDWPNADLQEAPVDDTGLWTGDELAVDAATAAAADTGTIQGTCGDLVPCYPSAVQFDIGGVQARAVAMADVTGNGHLDMVINNVGAPSSPLRVLEGDGAGGFGDPVALSTGTPLTAGDSRSVAAVDFTGDGLPDIAMTSGTNGFRGIALFAADGTGGFVDPVFFDVPELGLFSSMAADDVNSDGHVDLVTANDQGGNTVSVLLNDGSGGFLEPLNLPVGDRPRKAAIADVNGDGQLDIVTVNFVLFEPASRNIAVLLGDGAGGFAEAYHIPIDGPTDLHGPTDLTVADLDSDGDADLVLYNGTGRDFATRDGLEIRSTVAVLLGDGTGNFTDPEFHLVGLAQWGGHVEVADLNGDGQLDIAASNTHNSDVSVLAGDGTGNFADAIHYVSGAWPASLALADVNEDGQPDVVTVSDIGRHASVLLNVGADGFLAAEDRIAGLGARSVAIGDVDNDGHVDVVVANERGKWIPDEFAGTVSVFLGDGVGGLAESDEFDVNGCTESVALADFTSDGNLDVATANGCEGFDDVALLIGDGVGGFSEPVRFPTNSQLPLDLVAADFNEDGHVDVVTANWGVPEGHNVSVLLGDGAGGLSAATTFPVDPSDSCTSGVCFSPRSVAVGDVTGNGHLDIVTGNFDRGSVNPTNNVSVLEGDGTGAFAEPLILKEGDVGLIGVTVADVDGDGHLDILAAWGSVSTSQVTILAGDGAGGFPDEEVFPNLGGPPQAVATADLNEDGHLDVLTFGGGSEGRVSVLAGDGSGGLADPVGFVTGRCTWAGAVDDITGDGLLDVVVANQGSPSPDLIVLNVFSNTISVLRNPGGGEPVLSIAPPSLDFGDVDVGNISPPQTATLTNSGDTDATGIVFNGLPDAGFQADTSACGDTLPAGGSCEVSVTFSPAAPGPVTATLHVDSDEGATADLDLFGNGIGEDDGPIADISPEAFEFEVPMGGSDTQTLNVGNLGDEDLTWSIDEAEPIVVPEGAPYRYGLPEAQEFHSPVGSDRAAGISRSLSDAPADPVVLPAPQPLAVGELSEGFDDITMLPGAGWALINNSEPLGPSSWFQGNPSIFESHQGAPDAYIAANFDSTGDTGDISNWLLTPEVTIVNGTELCFWTRTTEQFMEFFDRLEVRMSVEGDSTDVGDTAESVGDFTELLLSINPDLQPGEYPEEWTEFCVEVRERSREPVTGRFAFRYWVTDSGPEGTNGDYIGIDTVSVTQPGEGVGCANPTDIPWLSATPASGTTAPGSSEPVDVAVDAPTLDPGDYSAQLCANTNDPEASLVAVPVSLTVTPPTGGPVADITLDAFTFEVPQGGGDSDVLNVGNIGGADLTWGIDETEGAAQQGNLGDIVVFDDINFTVPPTVTGGSVQWTTGDTCECDVAPFDFTMWANGGDLAFWWPLIDGVQGGGVSLDGGLTYAVLEPGATIGPDSGFISLVSPVAAANWRQPVGVDGYLGFASSSSIRTPG